MQNEIKTYRWGEWPEYLLTKRQMSDAGFQTGKKLSSPAGRVSRSKSPDGWMFLYDRNQGVPKRKMSDSQKAVLEKARSLSKQVYIECIKCESTVIKRSGHSVITTRKKALTDRYQLTCFACKDKAESVRWSNEILKTGFVILDTETTGLHSPQIMQIGIINQDGDVLLDTLVKPTEPCTDDALAIHCITDEMVANAPTYDKIYDDIVAAIAGQNVVIYNAPFDTDALYHSRRPYNLDAIDFKYTCAMELYSQYCGQWSVYHHSYTWQQLPGGDHTAVGDCRATLKLIQQMAESEE